MTAEPSHEVAAERVAALFAVDPIGLGGVALRAAAGPARERWLARLASLLPEGAPWRRVPLHIHEDRLLGGLDLAASLRAGRPVAQPGLLAEADGGVVVLAMAERLGPSTAAHLAAAMDRQELVTERHGLGLRKPSRLGVVALDEGLGDDERMPARLLERLAFQVELSALPADDGCTRESVAEARRNLASVRIEDDLVEALCATALALGVDSVRAPMFACRVARVAAALAGRRCVGEADAALAAALVLAPRATRLPPADAGAGTAPDLAEPDDAPRDEAPRDADAGAGGNDPAAQSDPPPAAGAAADPMRENTTHENEGTTREEPSAVPPTAAEDVVLDAARAAIPPGLLALLALGHAASRRQPAAAGAGASLMGPRRGRPAGACRGEPQGGARLNLIETLRAAAPWQLVRRREAGGRAALGDSRVLVRRSDFHVWRFKQRRETTTVFVVDASGSSALHRLAEAKGAVELLLADCYVRRDSVAVIAFRGTSAEVLLPPTRSLVRAKRSLAGLPGGGGTPLASGLASALALADAVRRRGATPILVLLTDGRANVARDGAPGRARAGVDALAAARQLRVAGFASLLLDTSPQPQDTARELAVAMGARYLPLPHAGAALLSLAVRAAARS